MTRKGSTLPGVRSPGRILTGMSSPGARTPAERVSGGSQGVVPVDADGVTDLDGISADRITVDEVVTDSEVHGFDFNVTVGGVDLFDSPVSPDGEGVNTFDPDQNVVLVPGDRNADVSVEITDPSSSDDADADVDVVAYLEDD